MPFTDTSAVSLRGNQILGAGVPQFNPDRAAVFAAGDATWPIAQCSREVPGPVEGRWTPDQETVRRLDALLAPALQQAINNEQPDESKRQAASGYYRQYFGLVVDGKRIVYVNGFHEVYLKLSARAAGPNWRVQAVSVCDGWTLFFGAEYDPASGTIDRLRFNGRG